MWRGSAFNDPFFGSAFQQMDQMMAGMDQMMAGMLGGAFGPQFPQQQQMPARGGSRVARIEEVPHDHSDPSYSSRGASSQPIVEEPDDEDPATQRPGQRQRRYSPPRGMAAHGNSARGNTASAAPGGGFGALGALGGGGGLFGSLSCFGNQPGVTSYAFSSTTYSSSGPNGVTYQASHSERVGPNGVREVQATVKDGRTGEQKILVSRALGDKERTVTRRRDAAGTETGDDLLKNISEQEADRFDDEWLQHAEQSLLGGSRHRLGAGAPAAPPNRYALPAAPTAAPATAAYGGAGAQGVGTRAGRIPVHQQGAGLGGAPAYSGQGSLHRDNSSSLHSTLPYSPANNYSHGAYNSHSNAAGGYGNAGSGASYLSADYTQRPGANTGRSASGRYV